VSFVETKDKQIDSVFSVMIASGVLTSNLFLSFKQQQQQATSENHCLFTYSSGFSAFRRILVLAADNFAIYHEKPIGHRHRQ
jgi:hypothetical protein